MAQVELQCGPYRVVSLMSREAADELGLEPGVRALASIKSTNVVVELPVTNPLETTVRTRPALTALGTLVGCALALSACGSSSKSPRHARSPRHDRGRRRLAH